MPLPPPSQLKTGKRPQALPPRVYKPGEILCEEGTKGREMFIIQEGKVGIYKALAEGESELAQVGSGGIIGEMSLLDDMPRSATVRAVEKTKAIVITQLVFHQTLQKLPAWLNSIIKIVVSRLRDANKRVDQAVLRDKERGICSLMLLLFPVSKVDMGGDAALAFDQVMVEGYYVCRLKKKEILKLLAGLQARTIIEIAQDTEQKKFIVFKDIEVLSLFEEYLILKSQKREFREISITDDAIGTLSNIAYVAQKFGKETEEGTLLSKAALLQDLAEKKTDTLEKDLLDLSRKNVINLMPAEEGDTSIIFRKEVISRIKKIKEWLPKFEMKVD